MDRPNLRLHASLYREHLTHNRLRTSYILDNSRHEFVEWERLYLQHKDYVLTAAAYIVGGRRDVAEDVLHDVFVDLCKTHSLASIDNPRAYLVTACLNRARDWVRRFSSRPNNPLLFDVVDTRITAAGQLEVTESNELLFESMAALPDDQREVVILRIYGQMTFREIGGHVGISVDTAKSRYRYALQSLRQKIHPESRTQ